MSEAPTPKRYTIYRDLFTKHQCGDTATVVEDGPLFRVTEVQSCPTCTRPDEGLWIEVGETINSREARHLAIEEIGNEL